MVNSARTKIYESRGRHTIYLASDLVGDDRFPFRPGEMLTARIRGDRLILEKAKKTRS
jgi:hypothetical protein